MPGSYKLRLSDGTLLVVDHDGLETWLVDDKAMVQLVGSTHWRPLKAFLAGERAAARNASRQASSVAAALPLIPPPPRKEETPASAEPPPSDPEFIPPPTRKEETPHSAEPPPSDPKPFFVDEPPGVPLPPESVDKAVAKERTDAAWSADANRRLEEVLPEEPAPSDLVQPFFVGEPPVAPTLTEQPFARREESVSPQPSPNEHDAPIRLKAVDDEVPGRPPSPGQAPRERRSVERPPSLLVLADDVAGPHSGNRPEPSAADNGLPIIRLKPRDDEDEATDAPAPPVYEAPPWQDPRDEKLFRRVAAFGGFLSLWLGRLERQLGRLSSTRRERLTTRRGPGGQAPRRWVAAAGGFLSRWTERLGRQARRPPSSLREGPPPGVSLSSGTAEAFLSENEPPRLQPLAEALTDGDGFARGGATSSRKSPAPQEKVDPPPPVSELPVLRLADIDDEPETPADVYEGDSAIHIAWRWTKRIVVIGGLLAGGVFAVLTSENWLPKAERLSRILFAEIDNRVRSRDLTERRRRTLQEAAEQMPYLDPGTIELLVSGGALELPDVFRLASEAADRGLSALPPGETQEWKGLRQQMIDSLRPEERQRALEYDRARGRRPTLPFEDREALELLARGARALPSASLARLQLLSAKAIAAGLGPGPPVRPRRPETD